eukprot:6059552-Amphidinium_carterae.1
MSMYDTHGESGSHSLLTFSHSVPTPSHSVLTFQSVHRPLVPSHSVLTCHSVHGNVTLWLKCLVSDSYHSGSDPIHGTPWSQSVPKGDVRDQSDHEKCNQSQYHKKVIFYELQRVSESSRKFVKNNKNRSEKRQENSFQDSINSCKLNVRLRKILVFAMTVQIAQIATVYLYETPSVHLYPGQSGSQLRHVKPTVH